MPSAYLAISYKCNQHCSFCPCSKEEARYPFVAVGEIKHTIKSFADNQNIDTIVISGGEPTIHPNFLDIIEYTTKELKLHTVILSNGERYADTSFVEEIKKLSDISKITAITTIHSQNYQEHEGINGSKGSFRRSIQGLKNLCDIGVDVIIKHCITTVNYKELDLFYDFIDTEFEPQVNIQLCSIDYCGLKEKDLEQNMLSFVELRPYLEKMFDRYIEKRQNGSKRYMYAINMPFCACDPYYWEVLTPKADNYSGYASPNEKGNEVSTIDLESNVGTFANACQNCKAEIVCPGTYRTAFQYFGDRIVEAYR